MRNSRYVARRFVFSIAWAALAYFGSQIVLGLLAGLCFFALASANLTIPDHAFSWINLAFSAITITLGCLAFIWGLFGKLPGTRPSVHACVNSEVPPQASCPTRRLQERMREGYTVFDWILGGISGLVVFVLGGMLIGHVLRGQAALAVLPVALALGIANGYLSMRQRRSRREQRTPKMGCCRRCGYDLTGSSPTRV